MTVLSMYYFFVYKSKPAQIGYSVAWQTWRQFSVSDLLLCNAVLERKFTWTLGKTDCLSDRLTMYATLYICLVLFFRLL